MQFDAKDWGLMSAEKKKRVDISKIALDYYTDEKLGINLLDRLLFNLYDQLIECVTSIREF